MKHGGGKAGRPFGQTPIQQLEQLISDNPQDRDLHFQMVTELAFRRSKRAGQLKDLVERLIGGKAVNQAKQLGPLFE